MVAAGDPMADGVDDECVHDEPRLDEQATPLVHLRDCYKLTEDVVHRPVERRHVDRHDRSRPHVVYHLSPRVVEQGVKAPLAVDAVAMIIYLLSSNLHLQKMKLP